MSSRSRISFLVCALLASLTPLQSRANTSGRSWSPTEILQSSLGPSGSPRLDTDQSGIPFLFGVAGQSGQVVGFRWNGNTWIETWSVGRGLQFSWPVWAAPGEFWIVGQDLEADAQDKSWFWLAMQDGNSFAIENVTKAPVGQSFYSAAVSSQRRWMIYNRSSGGLNLFYSHAFGPWVPVSVGREGDYGVSMAALNDTSALVAWASLNEGLHWGTLSGSTWFNGGQALGGQLTNSPSLSPRQAGGYWLGYAAKTPYVLVRSYDDGTWSLPIAINATYRSLSLPGARYSDSFAIDRGNYPYPAIAWSGFDASRGVDFVCAAVPTDTGWTTADQLQDDEEGTLPTVTRDMNGDVWVAYWRFTMSGIFITHTYTKAITSIPDVSMDGERAEVRWTLSEMAPETWWSVLRSVNGSEFVPLARIRAGATLDMSWQDVEVPLGLVRYRIRRECVDTRYEWLSEPSDAPVPALATLATVEAEPGYVRLTWMSSQNSSSPRVYRRSESMDWAAIGYADIRVNGILVFEDHAVQPGRYGYRLGFGTNPERFTADVWVSVPDGHSFHLEGFMPNPSRAVPLVAFSLATNEPASLEIYTIAGRRVFIRNLLGFGAGRHEVSIGTLGAGVYWIRLVQSGRSETIKGTILQ